MPSGRLASLTSALVLSAVLAAPATLAAAPQSQPASQPRAAQKAVPAAPIAKAAPALSPAVVSEKETAATQAELIKLLKLSPTMTTVIARDPSLLADEAYVGRNNPQLAAFLGQHPEVARNPDFYLFTHMQAGDGSPDEAIEREVWPEHFRQPEPESALHEIGDVAAPVLAIGVFMGALVWLVRVIMENRRWNRIFHLQSEVHGRLIEKFSGAQELAAYMETEAGRKFLEAAPIPVNFEQERKVPNALARVLTPMQVGLVLILLGMGFILLRGAGGGLRMPMLVLGVLTLMPGLGFILSAGVTWALASRMGLMPEPEHVPERVAASTEGENR